jgi:hypothetical protein
VCICTAFGTTIGAAFSGRAKDAAKIMAASEEKSIFIGASFQAAILG